MSTPADGVVVFMTGPDRRTLTQIGRTLLDERLVACLNIVEGVTSLYRWEGEIREEPEAMAILKTSASRVDEMTRRSRALHPYDVPEIVAIPICGGSAEYMAWVGDQVS